VVEWVTLLSSFLGGSGLKFCVQRPNILTKCFRGFTQRLKFAHFRFHITLIFYKSLYSSSICSSLYKIEFCSVPGSVVECLVFYTISRRDACTAVFSFFFLADPFWLRKVTTDAHIFAHVNKQCPHDRYPKLKNYV
jgi:hypothetical protein